MNQEKNVICAFTALLLIATNVTTALLLSSCSSHKAVVSEQEVSTMAATETTQELSVTLAPLVADTAATDITIEQLQSLPVGAEYSVSTSTAASTARIVRTPKGLRLAAAGLAGGNVKLGTSGKANTSVSNATQTREQKSKPPDKSSDWVWLFALSVAITISTIIYYKRRK